MKIGRLEISWNRRPWPRLGAKELADIDERYEKALASGKRLVLGTLCARSGTMWLCDIFDEHKNATGITERNFEAEAYYRFIAYNKLPIDTAGIIALIKHGILEDWKRGGHRARVQSLLLAQYARIAPSAFACEDYLRSE